MTEMLDRLDWIAALDAARAHALAAGALLPIQVEGETLADGGVDFRVEWISSLAMKDLATRVPKAGDKQSGANPFLPYERELYVADVSDAYVAILNKFPVWPGHVLLITRTFVPQEAPLTCEDLAACAAALSGVDGFVFFNSGGAAGASQPHRHLQMIPSFPPAMAAKLPKDGPLWRPHRAPDLPFEHVFCRLDRAVIEAGDAAADPLFDAVAAAVGAAGLRPTDGRLPPYNLLATRDWLLIVPRRVECVEGLSLSALGYAGTIGLRTPDQLAVVREAGPMRMLVAAAGSEKR